MNTNQSDTNQFDDVVTFPKLIGITGRKFNGKDTVGNYYVSNHGYVRLAFADALKKACGEIFGFTDEQLYGNEKEIIDEFWKVSPRVVLQYVGTDLFREQLCQIMPEVGNNIWVKVVQKKILSAWKSNPNACFVVTDVRFPNECKMIRDMGGIVIRVKRDSVNNTADTHSSETEIENLTVDFEISNNGTKPELYDNAKNILFLSVV